MASTTVVDLLVEVKWLVFDGICWLLDLVLGPVEGPEALPEAQATDPKDATVNPPVPPRKKKSKKDSVDAAVVDAADKELPKSSSVDLVSLKELAYRLYFGLVSLVLWENPRMTYIALAVFNFVFWGCISLNIGSIIAAYSAASMMFCYVDYAIVADEKDFTSFKYVYQIRRTRCRKLFYHFQTALKGLADGESEFILLSSMAVVCLTATFGYLCERLVYPVYFMFMLTVVWTNMVLYKYEQKKLLALKHGYKEKTKRLKKAPSDSDDEFLPPSTKNNLEVLEWACEKPEPTPIKTVSHMHTSSDLIYEDDLEGVEMPAYDDDCVDGSVLGKSRLELESRPALEQSFSESSDDEGDLSLKSKKHDKHWANDEDSESDFEFIDTHELDNLGNV